MCKNQDGLPGKPLGIDSLDGENKDGAMLLFSEYREANAVKEKADINGLSVFKVHVRLIGEVLL